MSTCPGHRLEDFLMWNFDLVVDGQSDVNMSLRAAEALGTINGRQRLNVEQFAPIVAIFEPYREDVERSLADYDGETQSWRDYAGYSFDDVPDSAYDEVSTLIDAMTT